jgi:polyphosphate glucokinase
VKVLVIDVGGTHIKVAGSWDRVTHRIPSGPTMTAADMVRGVLELTQGWDYEAISLGYPGPVKDNRPFREPINIAGGWTTFDFQKAFGKPVRCINDAAMQALGSYAGGRMLFLGLGTGLGTSIVDNWHVEPLEIAHLPYRKGKSYEEYLGDAGLARLGDERWEKHVHKVCDLFRAALLCDGIVLGGGNARKLVTLPDASTRGSNENAIHGGIRLWERPAESTPAEFVDATTAAATLTVSTDPLASTASAAAKTRPPRPTKRAATGAKTTAKKAAKKPAKTRTKTGVTPLTKRSVKKGAKKTAPGLRTRRA